MYVSDICNFNNFSEMENVNVFTTKSTNSGHYFHVSYWRQYGHFTWSSKPRKGPKPLMQGKSRVPSFLGYFNTQWAVSGIEPAT